MTTVRVPRYLTRPGKWRRGLICRKCQGMFGSAEAHDRHRVRYPGGDPTGPFHWWCHLPEEVGLVPTSGGWWRLPETGVPYLDPGISAAGGIPGYPPIEVVSLTGLPATKRRRTTTGQGDA